VYGLAGSCLVDQLILVRGLTVGWYRSL
jgi:hypothetical protein